jgi:hypothetical protein
MANRIESLVDDKKEYDPEMEGYPVIYISNNSQITGIFFTYDKNGNMKESFNRNPNISIVAKVLDDPKEEGVKWIPIAFSSYEKASLALGLFQAFKLVKCNLFNMFVKISRKYKNNK